MKNFETQYASIIRKILTEGILTKNRTGVDTLSIQNAQIIIPRKDNVFPMIKCKKMYPKMALKEMLWFMNGRTDVQWLNDRGVKYWDNWKREDGTIGASYGKQFRDFGGIDQLKNVIDLLVNYPTSRRNIMTLWNPIDLPNMALTPCMYDYHFVSVPYGDYNYIDLHVTQRSADFFLGVPYDLMLIGWLQYIIARLVSNKTGKQYKPGGIYYTLHDCHIYVNHMGPVHEYLANYDSADGQYNIKYGHSWVDLDIPNEITDIDSALRFFENSDISKYPMFSVFHSFNPDRFQAIKADVAV